MAISLYTTLNNNNGGSLTSGGTWKMGFLAPSFPITLLVNGVSHTYNSGDTIATGNPSIDFTGAPYGIYQFDYSVTTGCSPSLTDYSTLNINFVQQVNNECSGAFTVSYPASAGLTTSLMNQKLYTCATNSTTPAAPSTWYTPRSGDIWFKFLVGTANVASIKIDGMSNAQLAVYSGTSCAGLTEMWTQLGSGSTLTTPNLTFTTGSTYWIRVAGAIVTGDTTFNITITT